MIVWCFLQGQRKRSESAKEIMRITDEVYYCKSFYQTKKYRHNIVFEILRAPIYVHSYAQLTKGVVYKRDYRHQTTIMDLSLDDRMRHTVTMQFGSISHHRRHKKNKVTENIAQ